MKKVTDKDWDEKPCKRCGGRGAEPGTKYPNIYPCTKCGGTGWVYESPGTKRRETRYMFLHWIYWQTDCDIDETIYQVLKLMHRPI